MCDPPNPRHSMYDLPIPQHTMYDPPSSQHIMHDPPTRTWSWAALRQVCYLENVLLYLCVVSLVLEGGSRVDTFSKLRLPERGKAREIFAPGAARRFSWTPPAGLAGGARRAVFPPRVWQISHVFSSDYRTSRVTKYTSNLM